jgi:SAM-dependent methyltransferase
MAFSDSTFAALLPAELRHLSAVHWTPVEVATRAVQWLAPLPSMRVLDVGCGVGKLCVIGALSTEAAWYGVEQQRPLVEAAIEVCRALSAQASFVHGDALALDWSPFTSFYFYNPFETPLVGDGDGAEMIAAMQERLATLRAGTRVVTYHGLGGPMPSGYELAEREEIELGPLELWLRV